MTWRSIEVTGQRGSNPIGPLNAAQPLGNNILLLFADPGDDFYFLNPRTGVATFYRNGFGPHPASMIWDGTSEGRTIFATFPTTSGGRPRGGGRQVERFDPANGGYRGRTGLSGGITEDLWTSRAMAGVHGSVAYLWTEDNFYVIVRNTSSGELHLKLRGAHGLADVQAAVWHTGLNPRRLVVYAGGALRTFNPTTRTSEFYRAAPRGLRSLFMHNGDLMGLTADSLIVFDELEQRQPTRATAGQLRLSTVGFPSDARPPIPTTGTAGIQIAGVAPDLDVAELSRLLPSGANTYWTPSPNHSTPSGRSYRAIVLHTTESRGLSAVRWFQNESAQVSSHYVVTESGDIYQCVREVNAAWTQGVSSASNPPRPSVARDLPPNWKNVTTRARTQATFPPWYDYNAYGDPNVSMISIEIVGFSDNLASLRSAQRHYNYKYLPTPISVTMPVGSPQFQSLVALVAYLSVRYDIRLDRDHIIKHEWLTGNKRDTGPGLPHRPLLYEAQRITGSTGAGGGGSLPNAPALPFGATAQPIAERQYTTIDAHLRPGVTTEGGATRRVPLTSTPDVTVDYVGGSAVPTSELPVQTRVADTERTLATETGLVAGLTTTGQYVLRRRRTRAVFGVPRESPLVVDDSLRLRFEVNYKENAGALSNDPWKIEIYNLARSTSGGRSLAPGNLVEISAGYGEIGVLARGGILAVEHAWEQPDSITRILCGGLSAYNRTPTQQPSSGTIASKALALIGSVGGVLDDSWRGIPEMSERTTGWTGGDPVRLLGLMLKYHGLAYDEFGGVFTIRRESPPSEADNIAEINARNARAVRVLQSEQRRLQNEGGDGVGIGLGREGSGASTRIEDYDLLTRYLQENNYQPTVGGSVEQGDVERDSLYITRPDDPLLSRRTRIERLRELYAEHLPPPDYVISERSGMVGRVMRTEEGIKVKIRLTAGLYPGRVVDVFTSDIVGSFEVTEVSHKGDSWEGEFTSTITAARTAQSVANAMPYLTR